MKIRSLRLQLNFSNYFKLTLVNKSIEDSESDDLTRTHCYEHGYCTVRGSRVLDLYVITQG